MFLSVSAIKAIPWIIFYAILWTMRLQRTNFKINNLWSFVYMFMRQPNTIRKYHVFSEATGME